MGKIHQEAQAYINANRILRELRLHEREMTPQEYRTLRGQALAGDIDGAEKGLARVMRRAYGGQA